MVPPAPQPQLPTPILAPQPEPKVIIQKPDISDVLLAAFSALGYAVSARLLIFLSLIGAFVMAVMAMIFRDYMALSVLGLYCVLTVLPLVALELFGKVRV